MAFNENIANRIRETLLSKEVDFFEKKMFSGLCFMVDDKMLCGTHTDKKTGEDLLLCRMSEAAYDIAIEQDACIPMEFTGKPMKGFIYVTESGFKTNKDLHHWLQLCLDFNSFAKSSKKK